MDEGLVALITAGVGLLGGISGAAIGGRAAVRGARLGAETTARATARQVHDQATINHEHWLRGQRLDSCRALLAAYDRYAIAASAITRALEGETRASGEMRVAIGQAVSDIRNSYFQVRLLVSEDILQPARALRLQVEDHNECLDRWLDAFLAMDGQRMAAEQAEEDRLCTQLGHLHGELVEAARRAIAERPTTR
ncbi:hypothetical protein ACFY04_16145 [Streptomyces sp. NPDC001549]|uniref:hypothetical protein n=1 Tax=Streptomyces sp. NPDC001549 TaxID=3364586 RepID=UPI0036A8850E